MAALFLLLVIASVFYFPIVARQHPTLPEWNYTEVTYPDEQIWEILQSRCTVQLLNPSRPVADPSETIQAQMQFLPMKFVGINDAAQTFTIVGQVGVTWRWPMCAAYENIPELNNTDVVVWDESTNEQTWKPIIWVVNAVGKLFFTAADLNSVFFLNPDATVQNWPSAQFTANCELNDLNRFPFDTERCGLIFEAYDSIGYVNISNAGFVGAYTSFIVDGDIWEYVGNETKSSIQVYADDFGTFSHIEYWFIFKRKSSYFIMTTLIPAFLLLILQLGTFGIPPEFPERPIFSVTLLLSFYVLTGEIVAATPVTADIISINIFFLVQLCFNAFITLYFLVTSMLDKHLQLTASKIFICTEPFLPVHFGENISAIRLIDLIALLVALIVVIVADSVMLLSMAL